jgi:hypothetical protein
VTHPGRPLRLAAVTRRYNLSAPPWLPVWVENWVENRRCLESVETGAAWSRSVHPNPRTPGGTPRGCSVHCRYSEYMTVMKSDCQPADGSAAEYLLKLCDRRWQCSACRISIRMQSRHSCQVRSQASGNDRMRPSANPEHPVSRGSGLSALPRRSPRTVERRPPAGRRLRDLAGMRGKSGPPAGKREAGRRMVLR